MASPLRLAPLKHPVTITLDGEPLQAERGEPLAAALLTADTTIARSPKFHRPRAPTCLRGACDGCLARVDDTPNVMTCLVPASEGMAVVSQNRLGPRDADLLRMTDWFFPDGMNHHELFAGIPGIQTIMQGFARRVAGLGKLPAEAEAPRAAVRRAVDAVVVGGGPSGMAVAARLAKDGRSVEVLDDQLSPGGGMTALAAEDAAAFAGIRAAFDEAVASGRVRLRSRTTAGAVYGRDLLVVSEQGAEIVEARTLVLACGAHDGALAFEGNDVPGVMSARAAGWLLSRGILVGERVVVLVSKDGGPFGESFARAAAAANTGAKVEVLHGEPLAIRGTNRAKGVRVRVGNDERKIAADAVLIDAPRAPAYELCQQAGAELVHELRGFTVRTNDGRIADGIWATGEVTGVAFDARAIEADAERMVSNLQTTKT
jgi:sarcosine oxidase, subunit alpha